MIILRLRGGLGNQMFEYGAAKALALNNDTDLKFDTYSYHTFGRREFELDKFKIHLKDYQNSLTTSKKWLEISINLIFNSLGIL